ncbi:MAG TPA: hypothetical protein DDZ56_01365 [Cytophagales bacterium]|nr:hypothetical protein [Cytophagales bacterium]
MTVDERLNYCRICTNRKTDFSLGLVCGLTNAKPTFEGTCPTYVLDQPEADRYIKLQQEAKDAEQAEGLSPEKKAMKLGALGGIIMIVVAVVWFFVGLYNDVIFFYPPILLLIGIYTLVKGLSKGNLTGEKKQ